MTVDQLAVLPEGENVSPTHLLPRFRALDGLRGLAVAVVLLDHGGIAFARGGFLGVTVFFTLSGFLITSLLLAERESTGSIDIARFWGRRARRLVPGSIAAIALAAALLPLMDRPPKGIVGDAAAASTWVANWRFVFEERTYADIFSSPSPFQHFWSLAVEEQFYLLFPVLLVVVVGTRRTMPRARLTVVVGALILASITISLVVHTPEAPFRAYYGTDARAGEILVGALLAIALIRHTGNGGSGLPTWASQVAGMVALPALLIAFVAVEDFDRRLFEGGFIGVAVLSASLIVSALDRRTFAARLLELPPLEFLGRISYGTYLYHWPIFLTLTERSTGLSTWPLFAIRSAATLALAALSFHLLEQPVRERRILAQWPRAAWANAAIAGLALVTLASGEVRGAMEVPRPGRGAVGAPGVAAPPPPAAALALPAPVPFSAASPPTAVPPRAVGAQGQTPSTPPASPNGERARGEAAPATPPAPPRRDPAPTALYEDPRQAKVPAPPADAASKIRVAVVGDSVGVNLGQGLITWAEERGDVAVLNLAVSACPISRGGSRRFSAERPFPVDAACGWWADPESERSRALRDFAPDVLVLQDGVNEMFDRKLPEWDEFRRPGDPRLDRWLVEEYQRFQGEHAGGVAVVVTNAVCGDWGRYEAFDDMSDPDVRISSLNTTVYPRLPNVTQGDLFNRVCPGGRYTDEVEGVSDGRPDGLHFSEDAAAALARNWLGPLVLEAAGPDGPLL